MSFRDNLKAELTYQGILVKELSKKTGISKRTLDNYLRENGSLPLVDSAVKIAQALNVSVEYLVNGENIANTNEIKDVPCRFPGYSGNLPEWKIKMMKNICEVIEKTEI